MVAETTIRDTTVHLVDDDRSLGVALGRLLRAEGYACELHGSAEAFLGAYDPSRPACALIDINLPGMDGFEVQSRLAALDARCPVIFITGAGSIPASVRAMKAGAVDFLSKPISAEALLAAIDDAQDRYRRDTTDAAGRQDLDRALGSLTPRERDVLDGVEKGLLNKQIAAELGIAEKTVKVHRGRVMKKLGVRTLADLFRKVWLMRE
ncbi:response regulator transcription factor [Pseudooceanicola algae]|uniref:Response regulator protein TodT n=1 Tax=Pseudooceanicola algae TaxID=1537215 RepID=A0A418SHU5_9RHOB|nr:response regulator [Pseudooceanicola algae]QPM90273.1 Response regulator protein TodT [Pseudooceanicola algae]